MTVEVNGKQYRIEYDFEAACDMEDNTDTTLGVIVNKALGGDFRSIRLTVWGGLRKNYPDLTLADASNILLAHGDWPSLLNLCIEEMKRAGFFGRAVEKTPPKKKASGKPTAS